MRVTLLFKSERSARRALTMLSGAGKGQYRVLTTLAELDAHGGASRAGGGGSASLGGSRGGINGARNGAPWNSGKDTTPDDDAWLEDETDAAATTTAVPPTPSPVGLASVPCLAQADEPIPDAWDDED